MAYELSRVIVLSPGSAGYRRNVPKMRPSHSTYGSREWQFANKRVSNIRNEISISPHAECRSIHGARASATGSTSQRVAAIIYTQSRTHKLQSATLGFYDPTGR